MLLVLVLVLTLVVGAGVGVGAKSWLLDGSAGGSAECSAGW